MEKKTIAAGGGAAAVLAAIIIVMSMSGGSNLGDEGDYLLELNTSLLSPYYAPAMKCEILEDTNFENYSFSCRGEGRTDHGWSNATFEFRKDDDNKTLKSLDFYVFEDGKYKKMGRMDEEKSNGRKKGKVVLSGLKDGGTVRIGDASTVINFTTSNVLMNNSVRSVKVISASEYLVASNSGIDKVNATSNMCNTSSIGMKQFNSVEASASVIYGGANDGLYLFNASTCANMSIRRPGERINGLYYSIASGSEWLLISSNATLSAWNITGNLMWNASVSESKAAFMLGSGLVYSNSTSVFYRAGLPSANFNHNNVTAVPLTQAIAAYSDVIFAGTQEGLYKINITSFVNYENMTVGNGKLPTNSNNITSLSVSNNFIFIGVN